MKCQQWGETFQPCTLNFYPDGTTNSYEFIVAHYVFIFIFEKPGASYISLLNWSMEGKDK